MDGRDK